MYDCFSINKFLTKTYRKKVKISRLFIPRQICSKFYRTIMIYTDYFFDYLYNRNRLGILTSFLIILYVCVFIV